MENFITFSVVQTVIRLKEIIQPQPPPHPPPDKIKFDVLLWNNFFTEIYRNIQTFALKVLQECISSASRNGTALFPKIFFLTPNRNMLAGKFVNWKRFLAMLREHIIFSVTEIEVEVHKVNEIFWVKLYCKMSDLFL